MTVKELIEKLKELPEDARIIAENRCEEAYIIYEINHVIIRPGEVHLSDSED